MSDHHHQTEPAPPEAKPEGNPEQKPAEKPKPKPEPPYLAGLNDAQRQAVEAMDGPVLVLAGAGTGKTRVLTTRLAHLLATGRAWSSQILAVTFTNKASLEMKSRVEAILGRSTESMWLGTFHALGARILRRHAELTGLKPNFTILDTDDQLRLVKQVMEASHMDIKRWPPRGLLAVIERWKDRGLTPQKVSTGEIGEYAAGQSLDIYRAYQQRLKTLNAVDFGDLLLHCLTLFSEHGDVLADYQERFRYILVDEYQDANVAQYLWLRFLARSHHNICCVGDDDQSIYGWRGAEVGNILRFEKDYPGAKVVRLEQNYRSTPHILGAASGLIAHNQGRLGKTLWTGEEAGAKVVLRGVWDGEEEARVAGEDIEALQRKGHALSEIAILVRAGFQLREFEERFITLGLPYRVIGGPRFYERREIRDAIAYFRVIFQPDDDLAFERIVNLPRRGIGDVAMQTLHHIARAENLSLTAAAARLVETDELKLRSRTPLAGLLEQFALWRDQAREMLHFELAEQVLDGSGLTAMWQEDKSPDAPGRLENLKELVTAIEEFETLPGFLEHVSLVMEATENAHGDMVNLMTLHGAKGLEFDSVFLPGWEEGLFPHQLALDESGAEGLEEERRLAYVGLTRARKRAHILSAANRHIHNQWVSALPSRFIDELPADHSEARNRDGFPVVAALETAAGGRDGGAPGFQPRRVRRRTAAPGIDAETWKKEPAEGSLAVGARIFHQKFGYGRIRSVDGSKLSIAFEKAGEKKVIDRFVEPA